MNLDRRPDLKITVVFAALCALVVSPGLALVPVAGPSATDVATGASGREPVLFSALPAALAAANGGAADQAVDQPSGVTYRWHVRVTDELATWRGADARGITQVWAEELATGRVQPMSTSDRPKDWLRAGGRAVAWAEADGSWNLSVWVRRLEDEAPRKLAEGLRSVHALSTDGRYVAWALDGQWFLYDLKTGWRKTLEGTIPKVSGGKVAYVARVGDGQELRVYDPAADTHTVAVRLSAEQWIMSSELGFDGRSLVWLQQESGFGESSRYRLYGVTTADGSEEPKPLSEPTEPERSPHAPYLIHDGVVVWTQVQDIEKLVFMGRGANLRTGERLAFGQIEWLCGMWGGRAVVQANGAIRVRRPVAEATASGEGAGSAGSGAGAAVSGGAAPEETRRTGKVIGPEGGVVDAGVGSAVGGAGGEAASADDSGGIERGDADGARARGGVESRSGRRVAVRGGERSADGSRLGGVGAGARAGGVCAGGARGDVGGRGEPLVAAGGGAACGVRVRRRGVGGVVRAGYAAVAGAGGEALGVGAGAEGTTVGRASVR